jgi:hypothetical protein
MRGGGAAAQLECSGGCVSGKHPLCAMRCIAKLQGTREPAKNGISEGGAGSSAVATLSYVRWAWAVLGARKLGAAQ